MSSPNSGNRCTSPPIEPGENVAEAIKIQLVNMEGEENESAIGEPPELDE